MNAAIRPSASDGAAQERTTPESAPGRRGIPRPAGWAPAVVALLAGLVWMGLSPLAGSMHPAASGPTYSVASLEAHLRRDPDAWLHGPVRVRAVAGQCMVMLAGPGSPCLAPQPYLADPAGEGGDAMLPLILGAPAPWLALMREVPLLGELASQPLTPAWGREAGYTVEIRAVTCGEVGMSVCYEAVLADGPPGQ